VKFTQLLQYITPHRFTLFLAVVILLADSLAALALDCRPTDRYD